jgi:hypothetical protein
MIEKIKLSEVEKGLSNGVPANIRALDSSGNSISSSIKNVREVMGIYSLDKVFEPFEEYEIKSKEGGLILAQFASSEFAIGVAIIYGNTGGVVLNDVSGVSFFKQNERIVSVYRKENNGYICIKNNQNNRINIYVKFIPDK